MMSLPYINKFECERGGTGKCTFSEAEANEIKPSKKVYYFDPKTPKIYTTASDLIYGRMDFGCALMTSPFTGKQAIIVAGGYDTNKVELLEHDDLSHIVMSVDWRAAKWRESKYKRA